MGTRYAYEKDNFYEASSASMDASIKIAKNIDDFLEEHHPHMLNQSLCEHLNELLVKRNLRVRDVVNGSGLEKAYVYEIFNGKKKNPSRDKLIAIAFGLNLSDKETTKMLKLARYKELYVKDERDAIIKFCILQGMDITKTNNMLESHGFECLGSF